MRFPQSFRGRLALIVAAACAIRLAYVLTVARHVVGSGDFRYYNWTADLMAHGQGYIDPFQLAYFGKHLPTATHPPLWPVVLSFVSLLGGEGTPVGDFSGTLFTAHRLVGCVLGPLAVLLIGLLGRRVGGARTGLAAAGIACVYPLFIAVDGSIMSEVVYGPLVAGTLLWAYALLDHPSHPRALALGVLIGLCALTRSEAVLLLGFLALPLAWRIGGGRKRATATLLAVVAAGALIPLGPWWIRNWSEFGEPVLTSTNEGALWAGANCGRSYHGLDTGFWVIGCLAPRTHDNEAEQSDVWRRQGFRYMGEHLGRLLVVMPIRALRTWDFWQPLRQVELAEAHPRRTEQIGTVVYFLLLPFAIAGTLLLRRRGEPLLILLAPPLMVTFVALVGHGLPRYRHAVDIVLVVLAGHALRVLVERRGALAAALAPAFSTASRPGSRAPGSGP